MVYNSSQSSGSVFKEPPIADQPNQQTLTGRVIREQRGHYYVPAGGKTYLCSIRSKLRKKLIYPESDSGLRGARSVRSIRDLGPVAVGDLVRFTPAQGDRGAIEERLPRKSVLARRAAGPKPVRQVVVANADQLLAVFSVTEPYFERDLADRLLVAAGHADLPAGICINKTDLVPFAQAQQIGVIYRNAGYQLLYTSALEGTGLEELRAALRDKLTVLAGPSGSGKSTLLSRLQPGLGLRIKEVSQGTGKGRHATTSVQIFPLDFGGHVVDTPGIRYLDPWELDGEELPELFPEFLPYLGQCRFATCAHLEEPDCAVRRAVNSGEIPYPRYQSYSELRAELRQAEKRRYSSKSGSAESSLPKPPVS